MTHIDYGQGHGTLGRGAGLVSDARADLASINARLSGQVDGVRGAWGGQGAAAFFALHQAWTQRQRTIVEALDGFAQSLTTTEKVNVATDEARGAEFVRLSSRLG